MTKRNASRLKALAPSVTCVNLYGSTETQRAVGHFIVPPVPPQLFAASASRPLEKEILPLGRGIQEVQLLLLNSAQQLSGIGEVGEIYFRSPHLAKGYFGDPLLTKERFLLNPFTKATGDPLISNLRRYKGVTFLTARLSFYAALIVKLKSAVFVSSWERLRLHWRRTRTCVNP